MKSIPISNDHFLHLYLIQHKNVSEELFESMYEHGSEMAEIEQQNIPYEDVYEKGAKDFIEILGQEYCRHFLMKMADVVVQAIVDDCEKYCPDILEREEYKRYVEYQKNKN